MASWDRIFRCPFCHSIYDKVGVLVCHLVVKHHISVARVDIVHVQDFDQNGVLDPLIFERIRGACL